MKFLTICIFAVVLLASVHGRNINKRYSPNYAEEGSHFEGDIILNADQWNAILGGADGRTGLIDLKYRWPNNIVPYVITSDFDIAQATAIRLGLDEIEAVTCLRFVVRTTQTDYVSVVGSRTGCSSKVGHQGGAQEINFENTYAPGSGCLRLGTIIHEFIHAIGFYHMQSATERDEYVQIMWDNITPGKENNFQIHGADRITQFGVPYDYGSVMHYSEMAFSSNGERTIIPLDDNAVIGQRVGMSLYDIARINAMYQC